MATKTAIAMMALSHLNQTRNISDIDSDLSKTAAVLNTYYTTARDRVFRDYDWPFALVVDDLELVDTNPSPEWAYSYRYPEDAARITRIPSDVWPEGPNDRVAYRILSDDDGRLIYTNRQDAKAEYVVVREDPADWTADFVEAFSFLWAALSAPGVTGGDQFKLGARALQLYEWALSNALYNATNEEKPVAPAESEFITSRN